MMKNTIIFISVAIIALSLFVGCAGGDKDEKEVSFLGVVLENNQDYLLVEPVAGSGELASADKIAVYIGEITQLNLQGTTDAITPEDIKVGNSVEIFYRGAIAESYPAQINSSSKIELLKELVFTASDENFSVKTYIEKLKFQEAEEISLYSTIEYIGPKDSVEIWSGDPYFQHMIYKNGEIFNGGFTEQILKKTELEKGEIYTIPFSKNGGFDENDPDAEFWRDFYSEEELRLPRGEYIFSAITDFTLDKEQKERVALKTEFPVAVD